MRRSVVPATSPTEDRCSAAGPSAGPWVVWDVPFCMLPQQVKMTAVESLSQVRSIFARMAIQLHDGADMKGSKEGIPIPG